MPPNCSADAGATRKSGPTSNHVHRRRCHARTPTMAAIEDRRGWRLGWEGTRVRFEPSSRRSRHGQRRPRM